MRAKAGTGHLGRVVLVGAGPGDPGLLTVRGREALARADVVVYDTLVGPGILGVAPRRARRIPAEALGPHGARRQEAVNRTLKAEALAGRLVVRLKGGDPFVFGRGYEEVESLRDAGIPVEVVPGVTSALGGPAAAGIPVTHRGTASIVTIATGHESGDQSTIPWERVAGTGGTLVVLMCSDRIEKLARRLVRGGRPRSTPIAIVSRATWPDQEVRRATLGTIREVLRDGPIPRPALLVVGVVATLGTPERRVLPRRARSSRRRSG
jgi:uroporphyrin-III C-methyltransferase